MRFLIPALALSAIAIPAGATEPEGGETKPQEETQKPQDTAEKKICRQVRLDMSSRRTEKLCMTKERWIEFNRGN